MCAKNLSDTFWVAEQGIKHWILLKMWNFKEHFKIVGSKGSLFIVKIKEYYMSLYFDWKYQTKCNKLSFWKFCKKSTSHSVSIQLTDLSQSLLQSALDYFRISMDETVPGTILWHNYFMIFQFKVSWGLCCSPPEWDFPIPKLRKWHSFSVLWGVARRHAGALQEVCWDSLGGLHCGWTETSALSILLFRNSSWQMLLCKLCPEIFSRNATWHRHKSHWWVC